MGIWSEVLCNVYWSIKDGRTTSFQDDVWVRQVGSFTELTGHFNHVDSALRVCDVVTEHRVWDWTRINALVPRNVAQYIAAMELPNVDVGPDLLAWPWVTRDGFPSAETYKNLFVNSHGDSAI